MTDHVHVYIHDLDAPPALPVAELEGLLGGKGANLVVMATQLGLPVPPGYTISTAACRTYLAGAWPAELDEELRAHMSRLGEVVGRRFGDAADPLLVSVRSGAPVSMPGMMDTILNLGLNEEAVAGLAAATADPDFAADCLRRFRTNYREVIGADKVPDDPWRQLRAAIEAVFGSWNSQRAQAYRRREGLPDDLGTAVTVQAMVFGNRGPDSATGVLFTRNPATGEATLYGDVLFNAQGEDVVAGGQQTQPLSALEKRMPAVADELRRHAATLEHHYADLCDIEFTVEQGRLWLLQVRVGKRSPRAALRMSIEMAQDEAFPVSREEAVRRVAHLLADPPREFVRAAGGPAPITHGLPASPGIAAGEIVTSSDAAEAAADDGRAVILVRSETSPEDVRGMARAAGVLTARGGLASHAAVVARGWGIPAVVGAEAVQPEEDRVVIDGRTFATGEVLTIDGSSGEVFAGELIGEWYVAPEAATLLDWARDLGIGISAPEEASDSQSSPAAVTSADMNADEMLRALAVKGLATAEQLAQSLLADADRVERLSQQLISEGLVEATDNGLRPTAQGKLKSTDLFSADRASLGEDRAVDFLESFHAVDLRMKSIVTAWQMREVGGEQVFNDHSDAAYDAGTLRDLANLHLETIAWLAPLASALPRYATYSNRLTHALDTARAGDQRFVASPRVDSYHGIWFELHEDLIRLCGRRRSDEAAAGRA